MSFWQQPDRPFMKRSHLPLMWAAGCWFSLKRPAGSDLDLYFSVFSDETGIRNCCKFHLRRAADYERVCLCVCVSFSQQNVVELSLIKRHHGWGRWWGRWWGGGGQRFALLPLIIIVFLWRQRTLGWWGSRQGVAQRRAGHISQSKIMNSITELNGSSGETQ